MRVSTWITETQPILTMQSEKRDYATSEEVSNFFLTKYADFFALSEPPVMKGLYDFHIKQKLPLLDAYYDAMENKLFNLFGFTKQEKTTINDGEDKFTSVDNTKNTGTDTFNKNTDVINSIGKQKQTTTDNTSATTEHGKQHEVDTEKAVAYNSYSEKERAQSDKSRDAYNDTVRNSGAVTVESDTYTNDILTSGYDSTEYGKKIARDIQNSTEYGKQTIETILREGSNIDPMQILQEALNILKDEYIIENILRNFAEKYFYYISEVR